MRFYFQRNLRRDRRDADADAEADAAASTQLLHLSSADLYELIRLLERLENDFETPLTRQEERRLRLLLRVYGHALNAP